jgi:SAM-dependent methyltransferase
MASGPDATELARIRDAYERYGTEPSELQRRNPTNAGLEAIWTEWITRLASQLAARDLPRSDSRVLDLGCGSGRLLASLVGLGADPSNCVGVDLIPERVDEARRRLPSATILCRNAASIPEKDESFELVVVSLLVSSIRSTELARRICSEAARLLAPAGTLVWYDTRYPNPLNADVRRVGAGEIRELFPGFELDLQSITLLPPLARRLGRASPWLYPMLAALPPLRARYLAFLSRAER